MVRRAKFADGTPKPLPKPERNFFDKLKTLKSVSQGISPESRIRLLDYFIQEALTKGQLTEEQASGIYNQLREDKDKIREQIDTYERENFQDGTPGKSAFRKPFAPEIEKRIIELHQNNKLGAQAIADTLTEEFGIKFSRAPIGKRITALKAEGLIKEIPVAERAASINQRGEFYDKPAGEKYLAVSGGQPCYARLNRRKTQMIGIKR